MNAAGNIPMATQAVVKGSKSRYARKMISRPPMKRKAAPVEGGEEDDDEDDDTEDNEENANTDMKKELQTHGSPPSKRGRPTKEESERRKKLLEGW